MQDRTDVTEQSAPGGSAAATRDGYRAGGMEGELIWSEIRFLHNLCIMIHICLIVD